MKDRFRAVNGEEALPTLQAFIEEVAAAGVISFGGPVRETRTATGRSIVFDPPAKKFPGSFRVGLLGAREVRVGEGEVNGQMPWLDGRDLSGQRADGTADPEGRPSLKIADAPKQSRRSWICLQIATVESGSYDAILSGADGLTVVHRPELPVGVPYGLDEEGRGLRPVAQLCWNSDRTLIERIRQILHFDQVYRGPRGDDPRPEWLAAG